MKQISEALAIPLGWHYLLDLIWSARFIRKINLRTFVDAGAGYGIMQWWLAAKGKEVISIDIVDRRKLSESMINWAWVQGYRRGDLTIGLRARLKQLIKREHPGKVIIAHMDLENLTRIQDNSIDAVVSISALEHNPPEKLRRIVRELIRVLKPGGPLVATLAAAPQRDLFHEPSNGWCYTKATLIDIFRLPADTTSNFNEYDFLMRKLRENTELQNDLAGFYFESGNNGMPWGIWNPMYLPVGVLRVKSEADSGASGSPRA